MTFGEKMKQARLKLNFSQSELSERTGISERSLYTYEQTGVLPRGRNVQKIAAALNLSVGYLLDTAETNPQKSIDQDLFLATARSEYGSKGAREATEVLNRVSALFAGGDLNDEAKDIFFQSLMEVYLDSKAEARQKFSSKKRVSRKKIPTETPHKE